MKLLKHGGDEWKYGLEPKEGMLLRMLVKEFPMTPAAAAKISRTGADAGSAERERLLNESLAQHRQELKKLAGKLVGAHLKARQGRLAAVGERERAGGAIAIAERHPCGELACAWRAGKS